jgi:hypothetical protein
VDVDGLRPREVFRADAPGHQKPSEWEMSRPSLADHQTTELTAGRLRRLPAEHVDRLHQP